jgi:hypothetical protein
VLVLHGGRGANVFFYCFVLFWCQLFRLHRRRQSALRLVSWTVIV